MNKEQAYQFVVTLANAALKAGLVGNVDASAQLLQALQVLRPEPELKVNGQKKKEDERTPA